MMAHELLREAARILAAGWVKGAIDRRLRTTQRESCSRITKQQGLLIMPRKTRRNKRRDALTATLSPS